MPKPITKNTLFYGDNLNIMRDYIPDESIDLIYLDPPFNSNRSYNVLFKDESGLASDAQLAAFDDTWHWGKTAEREYYELVTTAPIQISKMVEALRNLIGTNQLMAYLVMITVRLVELHRVLKPTGSLYLHCDPTASHYMKVILDTIFNPQSFKNEIVWQRTNIHSDSKTWSHVSDIIFFYTKTSSFAWNPQYLPHSKEHIRSKYRNKDADGRQYTLSDMTSPHPRPNMMYEWKGFPSPPLGWRYSKETMSKLDSEGRIWYPADKSKRPRLKRYLDEMPGTLVSNIWVDIPPINSQAKERLGYPTQKPMALLERIIQASSNPGDSVLDPFCGCGTAIAAAEKLSRKWIGIDITHLAISLIKYRMKDMFPGCEFDVIGEPTDIGAARQLAHDNRYQFQWWALSLVRARPIGGESGSKKGKKGSDKGMDGVINFIDDSSGIPKRAIVQVKSGHVKVGDIRDLHGVVDREKAAIGVFITLESPTSEMVKEAISSGFYNSKLWQQDYPKIQILTIEDLLGGKSIKMPPDYGTFKQAQKHKKSEGRQGELGM